MGILMVSNEDGLRSFGHAWTEIHDGRRWRIADATLPDQTMPNSRLRYLPLLGLRNEGPGYAMDVMNFALVQPERIVLTHMAIE